jgi:hypothetical protein
LCHPRLILTLSIQSINNSWGGGVCFKMAALKTRQPFEDICSLPCVTRDPFEDRLGRIKPFLGWGLTVWKCVTPEEPLDA